VACTARRVERVCALAAVALRGALRVLVCFSDGCGVCVSVPGVVRGNASIV